MPAEGISASAVGRKDAQGRVLRGWAGGSLTKGMAQEGIRALVTALRCCSFH